MTPKTGGIRIDIQEKLTLGMNKGVSNPQELERPAGETGPRSISYDNAENVHLLHLKRSVCLDKRWYVRPSVLNSPAPTFRSLSCFLSVIHSPVISDCRLFLSS
ncbi:hypothetical protein FRC14_003158 [Serendipita sp. 396]|nr:hypothetical protein FRC14_003158 [Serendipita sp. 396]KAG8783933.1 hypothetical protein FRC15_004275 [Serendipita sp. 397]KAG8800060.1 hypothetical protein FRC16_003795 [Serendipita sp. 398]KAG8868162.1 hypothetical protein FRC20_004025 [Serendipita sp. 405]